jgi:lysophospholipase L1-like esterase
VGTILVVGDDIAFGYGDHLKSSIGISDYLPLYLLKERKLRTNWKIYNVGYYGSSSRDWMPDSTSGYFNNLKSRIADNNSTILLLFIGSNDSLYGITEKESIHNLKRICKELEEIGVVTFISTLPTWGDEGMHQDKITSRLELNKSIKELVEFKEIGGLMNGVDLDASNFEYRVLNLYISDGMHFSAAVRKLKFKG